MQKWEYNVVNLRADNDAYIDMDKLGREGWELVCVQMMYDHLHGYFKRPFSESVA